MTKKNCLSLEYLRTLFYLDDTIPQGLRWKISRTNRIKIGNTAGYLNNIGYYTVKIDGKNYFNHRIIFCMFNNIKMTDIDIVDHQDRNPQNNHPTNLRQATRSENNKNTKKRKDNTSGYVGVGFRKDCRKYCARHWENNKRKHIGYFRTAESAARARDEYVKTNCPSEFNIFNFPDDI